MQKGIYTHRKIQFEYGGKFNVYLPGKFIPLKLSLNNGSPGWRLNRNIFLSVKQFKKIEP